MDANFTCSPPVKNLTDGEQRSAYTEDITNKKGGLKTAFVLPQGLEPWTPTLRVSCSTN